MNIDNVDEIIRLRDRRANAAKALSLMRLGVSCHLTVMDQSGAVFETMDLLSRNLIRGAIAQVAEAEIRVTNARLQQLGVSMPKHDQEEPEPDAFGALSKELKETRHELDMYRSAWIRELGGSGALIGKRHLIDALCLTTQKMREDARKYQPDVVSKAEHDGRVTELLEHNNKMEERMRAAQRELKRFLDGTPAQRLAFAVEKAAAETIAALKQEDSSCAAR
jgi:hypothetical protein